MERKGLDGVHGGCRHGVCLRRETEETGCLEGRHPTSPVGGALILFLEAEQGEGCCGSVKDFVCRNRKGKKKMKGKTSAVYMAVGQNQ